MYSKININFQTLSYEDLSKECRGNIIRAFQFIPAMYDRLTFDKLSHMEAITKIYEDHKDLPGFSLRNIYRYLPSDNPNIPHRIVSPRHKSSQPEKALTGKLISTNIQDLDRPKVVEETEVNCPRCLKLQRKNIELEEALIANSKFIQAGKVQITKKFRIPLNVNEIKDNINNTEKIENDAYQIWILALLDIESGNVISATVEKADQNSTRNDNIFLDANKTHPHKSS